MPQAPLEANDNTAPAKADALPNLDAFSLWKEVGKYRDSVVSVQTPVSDTQVAGGTGFVVARDDNSILGTCEIVTDAHVVSGNKNPAVTFSNLDTYEGKVQLTDQQHDLAVVQVTVIDPEKTCPAIPLADSDKQLKLGDQVAEVSWRLPKNDGDKDHIDSVPGLYAARITPNEAGKWDEQPGEDMNRDIDKVLMPKMQHGDSGSPVFDSDHKVVGVTAQSDLKSFGTVTPIKYVQEDLDRVKQQQ